jgi:hypothetical protein
MLSLCCLWSCMLSVVSSYLGRVVASDSKRGYLCSIVATREKTTFICPRAYALFTLHTLLNAVICCSQLNTYGVLGFIRHKWIISHRCSWMAVYVSCCNTQSKPHSDPLDICTLSLFYQLPNYNLFTQHALFILWRDTTSELWTPILFPLYCYHLFTLLALFTFSHITIAFHSIRSYPLFQANRWDWQPHRNLGTKYFIVLCAGSALLLVEDVSTSVVNGALLLVWWWRQKRVVAFSWRGSSKSLCVVMTSPLGTPRGRYDECSG